jgi:hypothetical protein
LEKEKVSGINFGFSTGIRNVGQRNRKQEFLPLNNSSKCGEEEKMVSE